MSVKFRFLFILLLPHFVWLIYAESKTGIEGRKKEGALNHILKRHRQEPKQGCEECAQKEYVRL